VSAVRDDLDALDRGVVEAGAIAAEALARVKALEARLNGPHRGADPGDAARRPAPTAAERWGDGRQ
jgi:hypothetical protein